MYEGDLALLVCPSCRRDLALEVADLGQPPFAGWRGSGRWIEEGRLECPSGHVWPIALGVPDFTGSAPPRRNDRATIEAFGWQWEEFDLRLKTWDFDPESRLEFLARELGYDSPSRLQELEGRIVLDAGCGNGVLSCLVAVSCGASVLAMDLTPSVYRLARTTARWAWERSGRARPLNLVVVRGDVRSPPFREGTVDLVYSSGVLHHTPSTWESARILSRTGRPGSSFYVLVYRWRPSTLLFIAIRPLFRRLPRPLKICVLWALAPLYEAVKRATNLLLLRVRYPHRTLRENVISLNDTFAPPYNWSHTPSEAVRSMREIGYAAARVTVRTRAGFGVLAEGFTPPSA